MTEFFDILDDSGRPTGSTKARELVHKDGDWHKAVHIWIVNDKDEILLQKRSPNKDSNPNMWDVSSAGHLSAGDDSLTGAMREIKEELGLDIPPAQFTFLGTLKDAQRYTPTFINNEFNDIYLLRISPKLDQIVIQKEEIAEVKYVTIDEFRQLIKNKDKTLLMHAEEFKILFKALGHKL